MRSFCHPLHYFCNVSNTVDPAHSIFPLSYRYDLIFQWHHLTSCSTNHKPEWVVFAVVALTVVALAVGGVAIDAIVLLVVWGGKEEKRVGGNKPLY